MKKVGIITIITNNYGNRLQNYASQVIYEKLGAKAYTVQPKKNSSRLKRVLSNIKNNCSSPHDNFKKFNEYIRWSDYSLKDREQLSKYNLLSVGSDQVWNTTFNWITTDYFLPFVHECKVSLAASFGTDDISYNSEIKDCLSAFKAISVRENSGVDIVKKITGKDAVVLIDPTMMLSQEEWLRVSRKPKGMTNQPYILTYFLSPKCQQAQDELDRLKETYTVHQLLDENDEVCHNAGPSEFLYLIKNAEIILTDSFHASVFSFLFNKPFIVYDRNWNESNMNSRLDTLLSTFHLERKHAISGLENDIWEHDYTYGYKVLQAEQEKVIHYLREILG